MGGVHEHNYLKKLIPVILLKKTADLCRDFCISTFSMFEHFSFIEHNSVSKTEQYPIYKWVYASVTGSLQRKLVGSLSHGLLPGKRNTSL